MKKILILIITIISCQTFAFSQNYKTHYIKKGETVESIAKQYNVSASAIYALNPDIKKEIKVNNMLLIPATKNEPKDENQGVETRKFIGFETHKVKRKETLYSISKKYNVEIADIKDNNKRLYSENLQKGDNIQIPKYKTIISKAAPKATSKKYKVQPKEGKWRIAYKFGITVPELEALNPNMAEILNPGDDINVPDMQIAEERSAEANYNYYEVLPKEGFYRLKVKFGLTEDQLETLNPGIKESGLKEGMVIKLPSTISVGSIGGTVENTNLSKTLKNLKTKRLALMLPFKLDKIDVDSAEESKEIIKRDKYTSVSLDFYSGVKMALDSAKQLGVSINLKVFDTENQIAQISNILSTNDFSGYDAIIGPVTNANFDRVALSLKNDNVPVISPLMKPSNLYENVFQTIPSEQDLEQTMIDYVKADSLQSNVIIIADESTRGLSARIKSQLPKSIQVFSKKNKEGKDAYYINSGDVSSALKSGKNYVFVETNNAGYVLSVLSALNSMNSRDKEVIMVTTNKTDAFDYEYLSNNQLGNLKFHYPSINKNYNSDIPKGFIKSYKTEYGITPNKYAVRGFDLTMDVVLRLASYDNLYKASDNAIETEYVENKFRYAKKLSGGYYNESVYILKYTPDLTIEAVKE